MKMLRVAMMGVALLTGFSEMISGQRNGGIGQSPLQNPPPLPGRGPIGGLPPIDGRDPTMDPMRPRLEEQQARTRNSERQKRLMSDTNKLLGLAADLKQQMDKTNKDVDVVKKAEEIEKLAKSVKERMKG
jgi:hypothetical protein